MSPRKCSQTLPSSHYLYLPWQSASEWEKIRRNVECLMALYETVGSDLGFLCGAHGQEPACQCRRHKRHKFDPWVRRISWSRKWKPTPLSLPGESHGQRSLVGYNPWGWKESDMTDRLSMHVGSDLWHFMGDLDRRVSWSRGVVQTEVPLWWWCVFCIRGDGVFLELFTESGLIQRASFLLHWQAVGKSL